MTELKHLLCLVLALTRIIPQAHGLISPAGGGGGGGFFKKRVPSVRSSMPIDQLREALINSKAFKDLVERWEDRSHHDAAAIDAAQVKLGVDPPRNASNDPPSNGDGPGRARSVPPVAAADTTTAATAASPESIAAAAAAGLPTQREKKPDAPTGSAAGGASAASTGAAPPAAAPKPPGFNLFGRGRDGKKISSPKPAADKSAREKEKASAEAAARAEEQNQVRRQVQMEQFQIS